MVDNTASGQTRSVDGVALCEQHLAEILASAPFRSSGRSQQFLQHVVRESLAGRTENLKERVIGEQIFGRPADYDTGQDSIVRVKANEVRRRLAQFYEQNPGCPCRFDMAAGSYLITVRYTEPEPAPVPVPIVADHAAAPAVLDDAPAATPAPGSPRKRWLWVASLIVVPLLAVAAGSYWIQTAANRQFERFWRPFLTGSNPLLLCLPSPEVFRIYGTERAELIRSFDSRPPILPGQPPKSASLRDVRIVPEPGMFVGLGDARVWSAMSAFAASRGRQYTSRLSTITSLADLNSGPSIIVGAETNHWHEDLIRGGRYRVTKVEGKNMVLDGQTQRAVCIKPFSWEPPATYDCAVVTRLGRSGVGHPLLLASGLDHFGTYALGDFLTSPKALEKALGSAAGDWESKNLQILIRVERLRDGVGPPEVMATHVW